ncbi:hypothetical protein HanXRQr2_Chr07g0298131 [Helianthus annuus]|uniref:Uncharacterized protein n=1 Tax=Helianthus annuus TaxID=4232 RepID=A0A9K3ILN1_HELAN|nr:hypothetical protein HanXRQr2_Chr07g0298131 [Helianthus annuus]KAJ0904980.1 hypothetical protein HanPSC8_Chr07g0288631 [Helianthus annuus]
MKTRSIRSVVVVECHSIFSFQTLHISICIINQLILLVVCFQGLALSLIFSASSKF